MIIEKIKRLMLLCGSMFAASLTGTAQSLDKMQWFNEPEQWEIKNNSLVMDVTPHTDYWRISHYGFTVDDGPFYYATYGGEFEVKVKITGNYVTTFDHNRTIILQPASTYHRIFLIIAGEENLHCIQSADRFNP